jgi:hypothetical protein
MCVQRLSRFSLHHAAGNELQSGEFSDGTGLELYDAHFRQLDPQLGRFWQVDPTRRSLPSSHSA